MKAAAASVVARPTVAPTKTNDARSRYAIFILMLIYACSVADRNVVNVALEPLRKDFDLSDSALGMLSGLGFAVFYSLAGLPLGAAVDRLNRRNMIAVCLCIWTGMTALCGFAGSFAQLLLARVGVAVGESGGRPASMSMISDLFPAQSRATAMSGFYAAASLGTFVSLAGGGWVVEHYGWRAAFIVGAIPGPLLAAILMVTVREPARERSGDERVDAPPPALGTTVRFIGSQPALRHVLAGTTLTILTVSGIGSWSASFFVRTHGYHLAQVGPILGIANGIVGFFATMAGGVIADRLAVRDVRWRCWMLALAMGVTAPLIAAMALAGTGRSAVLLFACFTLTSYIWYGPAYALEQTLARPRMRGRVAAISNMLTSTLGSAIGPQLIGFLSDRLSPHYGVQSLRYALLATCLTSLWAATHYLLAARSLAGCLARAHD